MRASFHPNYILSSGGNRINGPEKQRITALLAASLLVPSILMFPPEFPKHAAYPSVIYALAAMSGAWEHIDKGDLFSGKIKGDKAG